MSTLFLHTPLNKRLVWYLAAEEYVAKHIDRLLPSDDQDGVLFVWIVDPTVIIGRHQVLQNEVNTAFCQEHNIAVYRRKSGGGCIYADAGNLMVSYIARSTHSEQVFQDYLDRMSDFLRHMGYDAVKSTHNDIMIGQHKVSGNACFALPTATIVHGTLLYNVDYSVLQQAITPSEEKLAKHGVESVRQRVINIRDIEATTIDSTSALAEAVQQYWSEEQIEFSQEDLLAIDAIEQEYLDPEFINRL
jgi:lipoic acid synthetase/lipoate-protein ligase A